MTTTKTTITFQELGLSAVILKALKEIGFEATFPIQKAAIPLLLKGVDVIGQAHTGTGKTAVFLFGEGYCNKANQVNIYRNSNDANINQG